MIELNLIELSSMVNPLPIILADVLSQINDSMIYLIISFSLFFLLGSIIWFTYTLWEKHQLKFLATQKVIQQRQLEMKVEYQKLINLYQNNNHDLFLEKDFNHLMKETFGSSTGST